MKIAFYCTDPVIKSIKMLKDKGGSGTLSSLLYVSSGLAKLGHDVSVYGNLEHGMLSLEGELKFFNTQSHDDFISQLQIECYDATIVVGHAIDIFESTKIRLPSKKILYWAHNWIDINPIVQNVNDKKIDQIIFVSRYHFLRSFVRYNRNRLDLKSIKYLDWVFNPMDLIDFPEIDYLESHGKNKSPVLSFLSFPSLNKGLPEVIDLFYEVKKVYPEAIINIFGSSKLYDIENSDYGECDKFIFDSNGNPKPGIKLHGLLGKKELINVLSKSDLAIAGLTGSETFCLALTEAMACFVPAVSLNKGGQVDYIRSGFNGYTGKNLEVLSTLVIKHFQKDAKTLKRIRRNAKYSTESFCIEGVSEKWEQVINKIDSSSVSLSFSKFKI
ncbi:glycosyltransferase family 4 protein [Vibrio sp. AIC-3]|uniref:glycosyltransferase family 4 protein n=1 Tax=Vibrio sp. AIC-3 TaxID=2607604 RepID=UPI001493733B|nr:glycosyltransferase family 4 protein [Vibrio sp. AIC-3]NOH91643.1 glycosyltransferase family 4 protein [Vibrio sp. AIC-3]